ncbi:hypothetical protein BJF78_35945 [Pseudonocardia sp. CNS-139]|nr:hypothetical protein BJF78_35945 [Pseudonocardia sp. CNS-139]
MMTSQDTQPGRGSGSALGWFYVHLKTETGRDAGEYVQAESEQAAVVIAVDRRDDVGAVIDAFPADPPAELPAHDLALIDAAPEYDADASVACARAVAATADAVAGRGRRATSTRSGWSSWRTSRRPATRTEASDDPGPHAARPAPGWSWG